MPNKRYSEMPTDAAAKETKSKQGMKNEDGRLGGESYNSQHKADANFKETFSPNDDVKSLGSQPGVEEGAY